MRLTSDPGHTPLTILDLLETEGVASATQFNLPKTENSLLLLCHG